MILSVVVLGLVTAQRVGELVLATRNTRRLLARGGVETGRGHYPIIVALHALWLAGLWILAWDEPVDLLWLALFAILQLGRIWVISTLGDRWTTRIITLPGAPLVRKGPYRYLSHPNYVIVAAEVAVLPLAFGLVSFALVFSLLNAAVLWIRIRSETKALKGALGCR